MISIFQIIYIYIYIYIYISYNRYVIEIYGKVKNEKMNVKK